MLLSRKNVFDEKETFSPGEFFSVEESLFQHEMFQGNKTGAKTESVPNLSERRCDVVRLLMW